MQVFCLFFVSATFLATFPKFGRHFSIFWSHCLTRHLHDMMALWENVGRHNGTQYIITQSIIITTIRIGTNHYRTQHCKTLSIMTLSRITLCTTVLLATHSMRKYHKTIEENDTQYHNTHHNINQHYTVQQDNTEQ